MISEPKSILIATHLEYPPEGFKIVDDEIVSLYHKLREPGGYRYENLVIQADPPRLFTEGPGDDTESFCEIGPHTISIVERGAPVMAADEFAGVVQTVLGGLGDRCPPFFFQRTKIQCLAQPISGDSIELLAGKVANVLNRISPFGRPPSFFGVRFRFLPEEFFNDEGKQDEQGTEAVADAHVEEESEGSLVDTPAGVQSAEGFVTVRFESYSRDPSQVWMEVGAMDRLAPVVATQDIDRLGKSIVRVYKFLTENCKRFLDQFDDERNCEEG